MPSRTGPTKFLFFALCLIFAIFGTRRSSNRGVVCGIKFGENAGNERFETDIDGDEEEEEEEEEEDGEIGTNQMAGCAVARDLGAGWTEYFDSERRVMYYHNDDSGSTQWEFPVDACISQQQTFVRVARLLLEVNGISLCVRSSKKIPVLSYQYIGLLMEPSSSWCWDPVEFPGLCYVKFAMQFELGKRMKALLRGAHSESSLRKRMLMFTGLEEGTIVPEASASGSEEGLVRPVDDFLDLLVAFTESFNRTSSNGIVYRNVSYFSREYGQQKSTGKEASRESAQYQPFEGSALPDLPFEGTECNNGFDFVLNTAEATLWQYVSHFPAAWEDSDFSARVYSYIATKNVARLSKLLLQEEIGETDKMLLTLRSADGRGALWWAYEMNDMVIAEMLVRSGAMTDSRDALGLKPHHLFEMSGTTRSMYVCNRDADKKMEKNERCQHLQEDVQDQVIDSLRRTPFVPLSILKPSFAR
jgi:hypothetical protein